MGEMNLPWHIALGDKWPFHISVLDAEGSEVLYETRHAYGSNQKTLEDVMTGRFMGKDAETAVRENAAQMARIEAVVRAVNRDALFDEMVEALEAAIEGWEDGAQDKGEYLRDKHGDVEGISAARAVLAKAREAGK